MQHLLDFRIYSLLAAVVSVFALIVMLAVMRGHYPKAIGGMSEWAAAACFMAMTGFIFAAPSTYAAGPGFIPIRLLGNLSVVLAFAFIFLSVLRYAGRPQPRGLIKWMFAVVVATIAALSFVDQGFALRVGLVQLLMCSLACASAFVVAGLRYKLFPEYFLLVVLIALALLTALRFGLVLTGVEQQGLAAHQTPFWTAFYAATALLCAALSFAFMLVIGRRLSETLADFASRGEFDLHRQTSRLELEHNVAEALKHGQLEQHYQPRVEVGTGRIVALEALMRWNHPQRGLLGPGTFISDCERSNFINRLGSWSLKQAAEALDTFGNDGEQVCISVNVSPRQFEDRRLLPFIEGLLKRYKFRPDQLELELTEGAILAEPERATAKMRRLKELGVRIALDDFGTGYSSLSYLKQLPVDCLKIDASFVRDLPEDKDDVAITRAVIHVGHALGLSIVAEGVERVEQLDYLRGALCDEYQGYFCSRAVPLGDARAMLRAQRTLQTAS